MVRQFDHEFERERRGRGVILNDLKDTAGPAERNDWQRMKDFAFLQIEPGRYLIGFGPFEPMPDPPSAESGEAAFYRNDFRLSDPEPWKKPASFRIVENLREFVAGNGSAPLPAIEWRGLRDTDFHSVFEEIQARIEAGTLEKSVPVITERGRLNRGDPATLLKAVNAVGHGLRPFGWRIGESGMIGATPEQLLSVREGKLETMALAGTAPKHEAGDFLDDKKEIREHEFVADYLVENLAQLGDLHRKTREVMDLGSLVHFLSRIELKLSDPNPDLNALIRLMHPTPALGAFPRGEGALEDLCEIREKLKAPPEFGAPFGVAWDGQFQSVVAIRAVSWNGHDVFLPSGCGIIRESRLDREWRELALKRNSVKALLGV